MKYFQTVIKLEKVPHSLFNSLLVAKILMILVMGENSHSFITRTLQERSNWKEHISFMHMLCFR